MPDGGAATGKRTIMIEPRLQTDLLWTDNVKLQRDGASDFVTTVRPGVRFAADGDRVKAQVDYSLGRILNAQNQSLNRSQNALRATGKVEAVENLAFIDFSGSISQESISAFGPQTDNDASFNSNRTEVSTFRIAPYLQGMVGQWALYTARYSRQTTHTKSDVAPSQNVEDVSAQLRSASGQTALTWTVDASRQNISGSQGIAYRSDRLRGVVGYPVTPQLVLSVIPGRESNNFVSADTQSANTLGGSVDWRPSDRTHFSGLLEKRFFGRAYQIRFEHRTPRTAWRLSNSRDVSTSPSMSGTQDLGPLYDLLFLQFSSIQPDPVLRAQLVESYMQANGLDRNAQVRLGFLSSGVSLSQRRDLSFTLLGQRGTLSFLAAQSRTSKLSQFTTTLDDLTNSSTVRQRSLSMVYSHRLTPQSSLSATVSHLRTEGDLASQHSTLKSLNVSVSTRLGLRTTASFGLRRAIFDNESSPYTESAVLAGVNVRF